VICVWKYCDHSTAAGQLRKFRFADRDWRSAVAGRDHVTAQPKSGCLS
jgi:hypothetical protein